VKRGSWSEYSNTDYGGQSLRTRCGTYKASEKCNCLFVLLSESCLASVRITEVRVSTGLACFVSVTWVPQTNSRKWNCDVDLEMPRDVTHYLSHHV
jgi:hypothetical protein